MFPRYPVFFFHPLAHHIFSSLLSSPTCLNHDKRQWYQFKCISLDPIVQIRLAYSFSGVSKHLSFVSFDRIQWPRAEGNILLFNVQRKGNRNLCLGFQLLGTESRQRSETNRTYIASGARCRGLPFCVQFPVVCFNCFSSNMDGISYGVVLPHWRATI